MIDMLIIQRGPLLPNISQSFDAGCWSTVRTRHSRHGSMLSAIPGWCADRSVDRFSVEDQAVFDPGQMTCHQFGRFFAFAGHDEV